MCILFWSDRCVKLHRDCLEMVCERERVGDKLYYKEEYLCGMGVCASVTFLSIAAYSRCCLLELQAPITPLYEL